ncbi:7602_t:CDS:2 [Acaulospora colombiana]|uniref:7602_t:CDS:1 n=1 Tax=Acaulospora colombiana TaxID=27376 RepID=A0ACA9LGR7_9GLOM|nr:7602_t:CDS:2 [Acaulospora colombiana]
MYFRLFGALAVVLVLPFGGAAFEDARCCLCGCTLMISPSSEHPQLEIDDLRPEDIPRDIKSSSELTMAPSDFFTNSEELLRRSIEQSWRGGVEGSSDDRELSDDETSVRTGPIRAIEGAAR